MTLISVSLLKMAADTRGASIFGGSRDIGAGTARHFAQGGFDLAVAYVSLQLSANGFGSMQLRELSRFSSSTPSNRSLGSKRIGFSLPNGRTIERGTVGKSVFNPSDEKGPPPRPTD